MAQELQRTSLRNDPSLVSYWRMEGNSTDSKGSNSGSDTGMSYGTSSGKFSQGASFNGSTSFINVASPSGIDFSGNYTLSFWLKPTHTAEPFPGIWSRGNQNLIIIDDGSAGSGAYNLGDGSGHNIQSANSTVQFGTYHMLTVVRTSNSCQFYINAIASGSPATISATPSSALTIGKQPGRFYTGTMDDIFAVSRALSLSEIQKLYQATGAGALINFI